MDESLTVGSIRAVISIRGQGFKNSEHSSIAESIL